MKKYWGRMRGNFYKVSILTTLKLSVIGSGFFTVIYLIIDMGVDFSSYYVEDILLLLVISFALVLPVVLTIQNIVLFFRRMQEDQRSAVRLWEIVAVIIGLLYSLLSMGLTNIVPEDWYVQLYNREVHIPIATQSALSIYTIIVVAIAGYIILRFFSIAKLPPLFAVLCMSAVYLGIIQSVLLCVQIFDMSDPIMLLNCLFYFNCILVGIRTIKDVIQEQASKKIQVSHRFRWFVSLLNNTKNWPWLAFIAAIPLLGIIVCILLLFGQEPDSLIKAWTHTADWNLSQKVAPQNIIRDEHYLCTVAAGGHPKIVKPIRMGKRHGHRVIVNRQLCIANAFEQLLEERTPNFHRFIRGLYDKIGYPISKHIQSPYIADGLYFLMKPLEWMFLIILYLFDVKPENRIAVQYPHSDLFTNDR